MKVKDCHFYQILGCKDSLFYVEFSALSQPGFQVRLKHCLMPNPIYIFVAN